MEFLVHKLKVSLLLASLVENGGIGSKNQWTRLNTSFLSSSSVIAERPIGCAEACHLVRGEPAVLVGLQPPRPTFTERN